MKILDQYVLNIFLWALLVFIAAFLGIFVLVDFTTHVGDFVSLKGIFVPLFIVKFYAYRIPLFVYFILPLVALFAAMFTAVKLIRANELVPLMACGISLRRIALPFVIVALLMGVLLALVDEHVLPPLTRHIIETDRIMNHEEVDYNILVHDGMGHYFFASSYNHIQKEMQNVVMTFIEQDERKQLVYADKAVWQKTAGVPPEGWVLYNGTIHEYTKGGPAFVEQERGRPKLLVKEIAQNGYFVPSDISPDNILASGSSLGGKFFTMAQARELAQKHPWVPLFQIRIHQKLALPFVSVLLLLGGLPFILSSSTHSFFRGLALCLLISLVYYGLYFYFFSLGQKGELSPILSAWGPTAIFLAVGLAAFAWLRT